MFLAQSVSIAFYCIGFGEVLAVIVSAEDAAQTAEDAGVRFPDSKKQ